MVRLRICTGMVLLEKMEILKNVTCLLHCVTTHALLTTVLLILLELGFFLFIHSLEKNQNLDACTLSTTFDNTPERAQTIALPYSYMHCKLSCHLKGRCRLPCLCSQWWRSQDRNKGRGKACKALVFFF